MTDVNAKHLDGAGLSHVFGKLKGVLGDVESAPYTEVEWVESDGTQFVYLDWKPPIATWGFEADFIIRNAFSTTGGAWRSDTNVNGYGNVFGTRNSSTVNDIQLGTYGSTGVLRPGSNSYTTSGILKTDKTRQQVSLKGTSLRRGDGTTVTVTRTSETANKPYANMVVFGIHEGIRRGGTGNVAQLGTVRIYSLKFYDGTTLKVDLVGAIRNRDGMTGLYDKVKGHFYPAQGMTYGDAVGTLGVPDTVEYGLLKRDIITYVDNRTNTRMLDATVPELTSLEDGQQLTVIYSAAITASTQTTELAGWDDTSSNSNLYLKVTLADGSKTEWIPCYYGNGSRLTSHYGAGTPILMTYRENVFYNATTTAAGTAVLRGWWADPNYNTDDVYTRYSDTLLAGLNGVKRYSLNMRDASGNWTSIMNEDNNTGATGKTAYTGGLMLGNVLYHNSSGNIAAGGNTSQMKESHGGVDFRYDVNGVTSASGTTELQLRKPVYLVGTVHSDGLFYLDQTKWWTQTSFETGKVYVHVGTAYSSYYAIFLSVNNPAYVYSGGKLVDFHAYTSDWNLLQNTDWSTESITKFVTSSASTVPLGNAIGFWARETAAAVSIDSNGLLTFTVAGSTRYGIYQDVVLDRGCYILSAETGASFHLNVGPVQWPNNNHVKLEALPNGKNRVAFSVSEPATYRVYANVSGGSAFTGNHLKLSRVPEDIVESIESKVSKSGDTMTGLLTLKADQYGDSYTSGALNLSNSNIYGVNSIYTSDKSDDSKEGIHFYRDATHVDTLWARDGLLYFAPNRTLNNTGTSYSVLNTSSNLSESNLVWGGKNFSGSYGPIDAAMVPDLGANRIACISGDAVTIEYSRDKGVTWTDYGASKSEKGALFAQGRGFAIGKADSTNKATANEDKYQLRVTIDTGAASVYTTLNKFVFYVSAAGSLNCTVKIQKALQSTPDSFVDHTSDVPISGWSGWNVVNTSGLTTYGNTPTSQNGRIRFIFKANGGNTTYNGLSVSRIMAFGGVGWTTPSNLARTGHVYAYDQDQNATFPAKVTATGGFAGNITGNVTGTATNVTGTVAIANGGTGATSAANARTNLGVPPTSHASSATTYGTGTDANYGHVKLSGATNSTSGTSGGTAATPSAVKTAYDLANTANGTANTALSGVNGTLIYDHTYTIANGVATFTAHVYCKGEEVTSQYADSDFSWSYRLSDAISETGTPSVVSLGTGKTKTINITTLGLGGHVIGTFTTD